MNLDYSLKKTSKCIDAGQRTGALDLDGTYADLGAIYYHQDTVSSLAENSIIQLSLMPNPVVDQLTIQVNDRIDRIQIYNINGQLVKEESASYITQKMNSINVEDLETGIYIVIVTNEIFQIQGKFVKL